MDIPFIPHVFDQSKPKESVLKLVTHLFPGYKPKDDSYEDIEVTVVTEGTTNGLFKVTRNQSANSSSVDNGTVDAALVKIYGEGTETLIDREKEINFHGILSSHNLAPSLLVRFSNGHAYQFLAGKPCPVTGISEEKIWRGVARELARWHAILPAAKFDFDGNNDAVESVLEHKPNVWSTAKRWLEAIPEDTEEDRNQKQKLRGEFEYLVGKLRPGDEAKKHPFVFGHGDLLSGNIILQDEIGAVKFIDYEHSTYCPRAFDLANHFSEWTGFECDYNLLPTTSTRREFIREYLRSYHNAKKQSSTEADKLEVTDDEVSQLLSEVDSYRGFPGFYWGLCAVIQTRASTGTIDFDYAGYAELRFAEYRAWREEEDGMRAADMKDIPLREMKWATA
ncbi:hypothetical protein TWF506_002417 [Arthrobotrys conoides]|uniref:ethanolamine kinase n=1 Tax=Arthrobotrys conoides TaxID=74498 RepID=A0AAN8NEZ5_9PEZI